MKTKKLRYERKYLVSNDLMDSLRKRLKGFVRPDTYALAHPSGVCQYTVRSIYFDNRSLNCYYEKGDGILFRRKFRIRGYNNYTDDSKVVFEIKRKIENRIIKYRAFMHFDDVDNVLESGAVENHVINDENYDIAVDNARRFFYHYIKHQFSPTVLVVYEREAYHGKFDYGTRITFDKNIRSKINPVTGDLYSNVDLKHLFNNHFILEIKYYNDTMPEWARNLVGEFNLRHEALSKYTIGYDVNKHEVLQLY